jgi:iron complex outermembrane receptor protein
MMGYKVFTRKSNAQAHFSKIGARQIFRAFVLSTTVLSANAYAQQVDDIVVTAQRREERLQDVPVAVTALSSRQLDVAGITSSRELTLVTPGLNFSQNGFLAQPQIRGVGTRGSSAGDESVVPIYIDGVYQPSQQAAFFEFSNIERIEVLKGPQATLFGRNAMGGAINIVTTVPSQTFSAKFAGSYSSYDRIVGDGYINIPLGSNLAFNVAVHANTDDGYVYNLTTHEKDRARENSFGTRGKLLWNASDDINVTLGANYIDSFSDTAFSGYPLDGNTAGLQVNPNLVLAKRYQTSTTFDPYFKMHQWGAYLDARAQLGFGELAFVLSRIEFTGHILTDSDASTVDFTRAEFGITNNTWTGDLRLTSNSDGPFKWILGAFAISGDAAFGRGPSLYLARATPTGATTALIADTTTRAISVFAEGTYTLFDRLSITAGLRYSYEKRGITQYRSSTPYPATTIIPPTYYAANEDSFPKLSPRLTVKYDFTPATNIYATYTQGFKSGLFNGSTIVAAGVLPPVVKPEVLDAFEVGLKTQPTRAIRFNAAAFYYDYSNLQVSARDVATGGTFLQNAAGAEIYGGEAELAWAATNRLNLSAGLALTHARFTSFPAASTFVRRPDGRGNLSVILDASGKEIPRTPGTTANLTADYTAPLSGGSLTLSGTYYYASNSFWDVYELFDNHGGHHQVNARVMWEPQSEAYRLTAFVENLTNDNRPIVQQISTSGTYESNVRPRAFGIKLEVFVK